MDAGSICTRHVVTVRPGEDLVTAARLMREEHVGYLVVAEAHPDGALEPVGVLTDRDIVVAVVAREVDARSLTVADVMTRKPMLVEEKESIESALRKMREIGVRRMPVVDPLRRLCGVLAVDDVIDLVSGQLANIAASIRNEQRIERTLRP
jgi:CBS domain-containing protein